MAVDRAPSLATGKPRLSLNLRQLEEACVPLPYPLCVFGCLFDEVRERLRAAIFLRYSVLNSRIIRLAVLEKRSHEETAFIVPSDCRVKDPLLKEHVFALRDLLKRLLVPLLDPSVCLISAIQVLMQALVLHDWCVIGSKHSACDSQLWRIHLFHGLDVA